MFDYLINPEEEVAETDKGLLLRFESGYLKWFPKKAIYTLNDPKLRDKGYCGLREWFLELLDKDEEDLLLRNTLKVISKPRNLGPTKRKRKDKPYTASEQAQLECFGHSGMDGGWGHGI